MSAHEFQHVSVRPGRPACMSTPVQFILSFGKRRLSLHHKTAPRVNVRFIVGHLPISHFTGRSGESLCCGNSPVGSGDSLWGTFKTSSDQPPKQFFSPFCHCQLTRDISLFSMRVCSCTCTCTCPRPCLNSRGLQHRLADTVKRNVHLCIPLQM